MKPRSRSLLAAFGVLTVTASLAFAVDYTRTCQAGGNGNCSGTTSCSSVVAWCCCDPVVGGARACKCATGADCLKPNWPPGWTNCTDP